MVASLPPGEPPGAPPPGAPPPRAPSPLLMAPSGAPSFKALLLQRFQATLDSEAAVLKKHRRKLVKIPLQAAASSAARGVDKAAAAQRATAAEGPPQHAADAAPAAHAAKAEVEPRKRRRWVMWTVVAVAAWRAATAVAQRTRRAGRPR